MIDTELRKLQLCELEILKQFTSFCERNGLEYMLVGGTLLGAVRHNGFIPWDDDIDVAMPRPDYDRFIVLATENPIAPHLITVSGDTDSDFHMPITKVMDSRYMFVDENRTHEGEGDYVWVDVMPVDGLGDDYESAKCTMKNVRSTLKALERANSIPWKLRPGEKGLMGLMRCAFRQLYRIPGFDRYKQKLIRLGKRYEFSSSKYVAVVVCGFYGEGEIVEREKLLDYRQLIFENTQFNTMGCFDEYLTGIYGDYMQLPPEEKRVCPHNLKIIEI